MGTRALVLFAFVFAGLGPRLATRTAVLRRQSARGHQRLIRFAPASFVDISHVGEETGR